MKVRSVDWWFMMSMLLVQSIGHDCWKSPAFWRPLMMRIVERLEKDFDHEINWTANPN